MERERLPERNKNYLHLAQRKTELKVTTHNNNKRVTPVGTLTFMKNSISWLVSC